MLNLRYLSFHYRTFYFSIHQTPSHIEKLFSWPFSSTCQKFVSRILKPRHTGSSLATVDTITPVSRILTIRMRAKDEPFFIRKNYILMVNVPITNPVTKYHWLLFVVFTQFLASVKLEWLHFQFLS